LPKPDASIETPSQGLGGVQEAIVETAVCHARPVILTALAAALAFVALTLNGFWGPLAYVLVDGVIV